MNFRKIIIGAISTIIIGGSAYTVSQTDIVNNLANDSGMTKQQAEDYVNGISKDDLVSFGKVGAAFVDDSNLIDKNVSQIDCINYEYRWESSTLSCEEGKSQLSVVSSSEATLGRAYVKLDSESATKEDIAATITDIDILISKYNLEIVSKLLDNSTINDSKQTNLYNKAVLKAALGSN